MPIEIKPNRRLETLSQAPDPVYQGWERAAMTAWCRDCDDLPKVAEAGEVQELADGTRVQILHNGIRVVEGGYFGKMTTEILRNLRGHHEPQEEKVFAAALERMHQEGGADGVTSPVMIELGAFWAYYSIWFQREFPAGRTVMIEPDPGYRAVGLRNLELNGLAPEILLAAAGDRPGELEFEAESDGQRRVTPVHSVDSLVEAYQLERVDVLHADVQGAELAVLAGAEKTVAAGKLRFVFLSTHHHQIAGDPILHHRCIAWLQERGAHVIADHDVTESFSGDGLVVASFDPRDRDWVVPISYNCPSRSLFRQTEFDLAELQEQHHVLAARHQEVVAAQMELARKLAEAENRCRELARENSQIHEQLQKSARRPRLFSWWPFRAP